MIILLLLLTLLLPTKIGCKVDEVVEKLARKKIILKLQDPVSRSDFAKNFDLEIIQKFYPRASVLSTQIFGYFEQEELGEIYQAILKYFEKNQSWFYVGDKKEDLKPTHLDELTRELQTYLKYLQTTEVIILSPNNKEQRTTLRNCWAKGLKGEKLKEIYQDFVSMAFCYQIHRVAAVLIRYQQDHQALEQVMQDPLSKAHKLLKEMGKEDSAQTAATIYKHYENVISTIYKTLPKEQSAIFGTKE